MSGGAMNYAYSTIAQAARDTLAGLLRLQKEGPDYWKPSDYYKGKYPEREEFKDAEALRNATLSRLADAYSALATAAVWAERVEWLLSDDDGPEAFILRTVADFKAQIAEVDAKIDKMRKEQEADCPEQESE